MELGPCIQKKKNSTSPVGTFVWPPWNDRRMTIFPRDFSQWNWGMAPLLFNLWGPPEQPLICACFSSLHRRSCDKDPSSQGSLAGPWSHKVHAHTHTRTAYQQQRQNLSISVRQCWQLLGEGPIEINRGHSYTLLLSQPSSPLPPNTHRDSFRAPRGWRRTVTKLLQGDSTKRMHLPSSGTPATWYLKGQRTHIHSVLNSCITECYKKHALMGIHFMATWRSTDQTCSNTFEVTTWWVHMLWVLMPWIDGIVKSH